jgi:hypothetical protein
MNTRGGMTPKQAQTVADMGKTLVAPAVPDDRLGALRRLAQRLAQEIDGEGNPQVGGRAIAVLAVQLRATLLEITELAPQSDESALDVIAARRAERARRGEPSAPSHAVTRGTRQHG